MLGQPGFRLNEFEFGGVEPVEHISGPVNLHLMQNQILKAGIKPEGQTAGVLHPGFVFHQLHDPGERFLVRRMFLPLEQQVARAVGISITGGLRRRRPRNGLYPRADRLKRDIGRLRDRGAAELEKKCNREGHYPGCPANLLMHTGELMPQAAHLAITMLGTSF